MKSVSGLRAGLAGAACLSLALLLGSAIRARTKSKQAWIASPRALVEQRLSFGETTQLPYPPDVLPGSRDVETPYGSIHVFEWGPDQGEKVLLLHGGSTPSLALADMAQELVREGYRVMLFDLFGRGYSDNPTEVEHDLRLYTSQILLVLASSRLPWTGDNAFHIMGYSLGGGIAASFARYHPHMVRSLVLVAGGGLIRSSHISWRSRVLYSTGFLPAWVLERLVEWRLAPKEVTKIMAAEGEVGVLDKPSDDDNDEASVADFDQVVISRSRPGFTVADVMAWQLRHHKGLVKAFMSSIRRGPIYDEVEDWSRLGSLLAQRRGVGGDKPPGLIRGQILLVLGKSDPLVVEEEVVPDTKRVLGEDAVRIAVLDCGHEIAIVRGQDVARSAIEFWR